MKLLQATFLALLSLSFAALAQTYPERIRAHVNDYAGLLSDQQERELVAQLEAFEATAGVEMEVITINSMQEYGHTGKIEPYATDLFNSWGIGDGNRHVGVMMLVARDDRVLRIEVGSGYGSKLDRPMKRIIDRTIIPEFKQDDYASGIALGVAAVVDEISGENQATDASEENIIRRIYRTVGNWIYLALAPVFGFGAWAVRRWLTFSIGSL